MFCHDRMLACEARQCLVNVGPVTISAVTQSTTGIGESR